MKDSNGLKVPLVVDRDYMEDPLSGVKYPLGIAKNKNIRGAIAPLSVSPRLSYSSSLSS